MKRPPESVKATIRWPRNVYLVICELSRAEGQGLSAWIRSLAAERLRQASRVALKEKNG